MKYRFFTVPVMEPDAAENEINAFCSSHRIGGIDKHFVAEGRESFWAFCITYVEEKSSRPQKDRTDYRDVLAADEFGVFSKLRVLRKTLSEEEGIPAYALFTNAQLADMVRKKMVTKAALESIKGVGKSRIAKYGDAFLEILGKAYNSGDQESPCDETRAN